MKVIRVEESSLTIARIKAFEACHSDIIFLVDDDNILSPDYLKQGIDQLQANLHWGAIGGRIVPEFEHPCPKWLLSSSGNLAIRDFGENQITSRSLTFGPAMPVGAGMIIRKCVADHFLKRLPSYNFAEHLGRSNNSLLGGEDTLIAAGAIQLDLELAYCPLLVLTHIIPRYRLTRSYAARLNFSLGRSHAKVCQLLQFPIEKQTFTDACQKLIAEAGALYNKFESGWYLPWLWHLGFLYEAHKFWAPLKVK